MSLNAEWQTDWIIIKYIIIREILPNIAINIPGILKLEKSE